MADTKNVKATQQFLLKGRKVLEGEVVAKTDFPNKQDWQNLLHMPKPRVKETDDPVGKPKPRVEETDETDEQAANAVSSGKTKANPAMPGA